MTNKKKKFVQIVRVPLKAIMASLIKCFLLGCTTRCMSLVCDHIAGECDKSSHVP